MKYTEKVFRGEQVHRYISVVDFNPRYFDDAGIIENANGQNRLRHMVRVLQKHAICGTNLDLFVMRMEDGKGYHLMTYNRSWKGRESYYAGIITGVESVRRKRKKRQAYKGVA